MIPNARHQPPATNHQPQPFLDQMGREVAVDWPPRRIVSLVPSQTELLYSLGLEQEVVGITKFCVHPIHWRKRKVKVGGTKTPDLVKIRQLQPDLIIGNKEENEQESIELLAQEFPVWMSDMYSLEDALQMMEKIGVLTNRLAEAERLIEQIRRGFAGLRPLLASPRALYLIWRKPWMGVGSQTFVHHMLERCGLKNVLTAQERYPQLSNADIQALDPEVVLLSSEPYPFKEKHLAELQHLLPRAKLLLVDGEIFSWYGSRLLLAPDYFSKLQRGIENE